MIQHSMPYGTGRFGYDHIPSSEWTHQKTIIQVESPISRQLHTHKHDTVIFTLDHPTTYQPAHPFTNKPHTQTHLPWHQFSRHTTIHTPSLPTTNWHSLPQPPPYPPYLPPSLIFISPSPSLPPSLYSSLSLPPSCYLIYHKSTTRLFYMYTYLIHVILLNDVVKYCV